jgi:RNA polymerase sigma-70 factor (ECF subfamily)
MIETPPVEQRTTGPALAPAADFASFYAAHRVQLFRALVVVTRDVRAAEDVSQDAFVAIWERWERVRRMEDPTGYLYRTALNGWFQIRRRAARALRAQAIPRQAADPIRAVEDRDDLARRLLDQVLALFGGATPGPDLEGNLFAFTLTFEVTV